MQADGDSKFAESAVVAVMCLAPDKKTPGRYRITDFFAETQVT